MGGSIIRFPGVGHELEDMPTALLPDVHPQRIVKQHEHSMEYSMTHRSRSPKRLLVVGAGSVGQLLGCLTSARGHQVSFLVKPQRVLGKIVIHDLDRAQVHTLERPSTIVASDAIDPPDVVIVSVRGDQIDEALTLTRPYLAAHTSVAVVPPLMHDLLTCVRKSGIEHPAFAMLISFGVWPVGNELHWFRFREGAILLSCEGDAAALPAAEAFESMLHDAGLRTHSRIVLPASVQAMMAGKKTLLTGWQLADWDIDRLVADREPGALTTAAIIEAAGVVLANEADAAGSVLAGMPSLEQRAASMGDNMRAIWRYHGPRIAQQTRMMVDALINHGLQINSPVNSLQMLRACLINHD